MSTLILCGLTEGESREFLDAERVLLEELTSQKDPGELRVHTAHRRELPDPAEAEQVRSLSLELLGTLGLEAGDVQTEYLTKNGFTFLAIRTSEEKTPEAAAPPSPVEKRRRPTSRLAWQIPVFGVGAMVILALLYYGIGFILTRVMEGRYADRDCAGVAGLSEFVETAYPMSLAPFTDLARKQSEECRAYLNAESLHEQKSWEAAYPAYQAYQKAYPKGIYVKEAREQEADSLFGWASDLRSQKQFSAAVDNLNLLVEQYGNTAVAPKAQAALPETFLEWGRDLRSKNEFGEAETIYRSLSQWATSADDKAYATSAGAGLAQTYFEWGRDLQTKNDFAEALNKFNEAAATDPDPNADDSPTAQTNAHLPGFHRAWGEYLVSQGSFEDAIGHFETSISTSDPKDAEDARNALTQAYLQWMEALSGKEEFNEALSKAEPAKASAATDEFRGKVDAAYETTLNQFAQSTGQQASKIIKDATQSICEDGKVVEALPILGILEEKQLNIFGVELALPAGVVAKAPGNLHFVVCGDEREVTVETCPYYSRYSRTPSFWINRVRYDWNLRVFDTQSGKHVTEKLFTGSSPEGCPSTHAFYYGSTIHYHHGKEPSTESIVDWLKELLK